MVRIIGIDPGLRHTGWGVIECDGPRLSYVACGALHSDAAASLAERLLHIHRQLLDVIARHAPDEAAIEETFVNRDGRATLKLGQARGAAMLAPASLGLSIAEYAPNLVKKSVVGAGHAEKQQVKHMVKMLLPRAELSTADAADALAIAICHAHHRGRQNLTRALAEAGQRA
jgi:crossover junction endodeoxyribonuclease RuvC